MSIAAKTKPPRGAHEIDRASFDKLVWPDYDVSLPDGAGWATTRVGSQLFCTWMPAREVAS